jgi:hypothetical protein
MKLKIENRLTDANIQSIDTSNGSELGKDESKICNKTLFMGLRLTAATR